jgi:hypothetical protein
MKWKQIHKLDLRRLKISSLFQKERRIHRPNGVVGFSIEFGCRLLEHQFELHSKQLQSSQDTTQECIELAAASERNNGANIRRIQGFSV